MYVCSEGGDEISQNLFPFADSRSVQEASSFGDDQLTMICFPLEVSGMKGTEQAPFGSVTIVIHPAMFLASLA